MKSRRKSTLQGRVFALVAFLVLFLVGLMVVTFPRQRLAALKAALTSRATSYAYILSTQLEPAVAFDDRQTAREALDTLTKDVDVVGSAAFGEGGVLLASDGVLVGEPAPMLEANTLRVSNSGEQLRVTAPIVPREGNRGVVVIVLSKASLVRSQAEVYRTTAIIAAAALTLGLLAAWFISRGIARRLAAITSVAARIARGELDQPPIADTSGDEIGELAHAFDVMLARVRDLLSERERSAREEKGKLEALVWARTQDLAERNGEMGMVLANLSEGILTVDASGNLGNEHSRVIETWFGAPRSGARFVDFVERLDPAFAVRFELGWEAVTDDWLPLELALEQLPETMCAESRTYQVRLQPMTTARGGRRYLVVIRDITELLVKEHEEAAHRDLAAALRRMNKDRSGFTDFLEEAMGQARSIATRSRADTELRRELHTLKGNCGLVDLVDLARLCHEMETSIEASGDLPPVAQRKALESRLAYLAEALGRPERPAIELSFADHEWLVRGIESNAPRSEMLSFVRSLTLEPAAVQLRRLAEHVEALAPRVGKRVEVVVEDGGVRLDRASWSRFWGSLVHAARNAVSHGLETPAEREGRGKPPTGAVTLRARASSDGLLIEVGDDGRGIAWDEVARAASTRGLPIRDRDDLVAALCSPGFSTASEVGELSGRGQGLGALRAEVNRLNGTLRVESLPGSGTLFACSFPSLPSEVATPDAIELVA